MCQKPFTYYVSRNSHQDLWSENLPFLQYYRHRSLQQLGNLSEVTQLVSSKLEF